MSCCPLLLVLLSSVTKLVDSSEHKVYEVASVGDIREHHAAPRHDVDSGQYAYTVDASASMPTITLMRKQTQDSGTLHDFPWSKLTSPSEPSDVDVRREPRPGMRGRETSNADSENPIWAAGGQRARVSTGWCVDSEGTAPQTGNHVQRMDDADSCWNLCKEDDKAKGCSFHAPTGICTKYKGDVIGGNEAAGYTCQIKADAATVPPADVNDQVWHDPVESDPMSTRPVDIQMAEKELEKLDTVIAGAEAEAGLPDTTGIEPLPNVQKEDVERETDSSLIWVAFLLIGVCCVWTMAWAVFARRFLAPKSEALLADQTEETGEGEEYAGEGEGEADGVEGFSYPYEGEGEGEEGEGEEDGEGEEAAQEASSPTWSEVEAEGKAKKKKHHKKSKKAPEESGWGFGLW